MSLDDRLQALSAMDYQAPLDGLEGKVWSRLEKRRLAVKVASPGIQLAAAAAALALGMIVGLGAGAKSAKVYGSEIQVLSDDSVAPSIRLGGA